jgi:multidrug efflux pump subunit AcrB
LGNDEADGCPSPVHGKPRSERATQRDTGQETGEHRCKGDDAAAKDRKDWAREFADMPIVTTAAGAVLRLADVAVVRDDFTDSDRIGTYNGKRAIGLAVNRVGEQTPIGVSEATRLVLAVIEADLPEGVEVAINRDQSEVYKQRLELLLKNAFIGLVLVLVLLGVFLETKLAFWVTMGIPISFLGSFLFLYPAGVSINNV